MTNNLFQLLLKHAESNIDCNVFATVDSEDDLPYAAYQLLNRNDPFALIKESIEPTKLNVVFTNELNLLKGLPHLSDLKDQYLVINVDIKYNDYSVISTLKDLNIISLISNDYNTAIKNTNVAYSVASKSRAMVLNFINYEKCNDNLQDIDASELLPLDFGHGDQLLLANDILSALDDFLLYSTSSEDASVAIINLSPYGKEFSECLPVNVSLIDINVYRPWDIEKLLSLFAPSIKKIVIIQGASADTDSDHAHTFEPLLLDFFSDFNRLLERTIDQVILTKVGLISLSDIKDSLEIIVSNTVKDTPNSHLFVGKSVGGININYSNSILSSIEHKRSLESSYIRVLQQLFSSNLNILNEFHSNSIVANSPEYGFGYLLNSDKIRERLVDNAKGLLDVASFGDIPLTDAINLVKLLSKWIGYNSSSKNVYEDVNEVSTAIFNIFETYPDSKSIKTFLEISTNIENYLFKSNWIIGSDAWSYDVGNSGVHQVLNSKKNVNMLIIDSETASDRTKNVTHSKKNIGLYAMNFHTVYVASVAVYSSYTQLLTALLEAAKFEGPSVVIAYLPYEIDYTPIDILKETKIAVNSGYWPLYRYDPSVEDDDKAFQLESSVIRKELQDFLDRENKLTLLTKKEPRIEINIEHSVSDTITRKIELRNKVALDQLLNGLSGPPLHIYYASDGGNASSIANRLANRGTARSLKATALSMDTIVIDELSGEENVVFITSTAGQGEFPQDGKTFWQELKMLGQTDLSNLKFSVFGLGDSKYWPRKEDSRYFNKPSKDLFAKLESLGAVPFVPLTLGDDQDDNGYETAYSQWEQQLWVELGVDKVEVTDEPKELTSEDVKLQSNFLRGTLATDLLNEETGNITNENTQIAKFHGLYMQDDRDIRATRKEQGLEPLYAFMARVRTPHGTASPEQWLLIDKLSDETGNGTIKLTNRATFQLHGVLKKDIKHTIRSMNSLLMDTLAGSGDVNRDVMISAIPENKKVHEQLVSIGKQISEYFLPKTTAYHEIWLHGIDERDDDPTWPNIFENRKEGPRKKKTMVSGNALVDVEPIYSPVYLPRKFKVNIAAPPYNDVDVWSSDVGLISIINPETQEIEGFNLLAGGGMGTTHNNIKTWPDTGKMLGFVSLGNVIKAIESVLIFQRDNGDRTNRKHARLRYTINTVGFESFKDIVEGRLDFKFQPPRDYAIDSNVDKFGWVKDESGLNHFTTFIENGRVLDVPGMNQKTGLREIAKFMQLKKCGEFRLTGNQHIIISKIEDTYLPEFKELLEQYQLDNLQLSGLRLSSSSCVGFPTCGLAMAESERFFPIIVTQIEDTLEDFGLRHDSVVLRITGCGNGCSRPWLAEVALIGKAPNTYNIMLGGGYHGNRLNKLYRSNVNDKDICGILKPLFKQWALERNEAEHFGDFLIRKDIIKESTEGKYFHDNVAQEAY